MKPRASNENEEGLLEYLEDIIGTAHYAEEIETTAKLLDAANLDCSEKIIRARHAEKELEALTEEKETAELFLKLENAIVTKKSELFQVLKYQTSKLLAKAKDTLETATAALKMEQEKNALQINSTESIEGDMKERNNKLCALEREFNELGKRMKKLENEDVSLREKKAFLKKKLTSFSKSSSDAEKKKSEAEREVVNLTVEKDKLEQQHCELLAGLSKAEEEMAKIMASLSGKSDNLQTKLSTKQQEVAPWQEACRAASGAFEIAQKALDAFKQKLSEEEGKGRETEILLEIAQKDLEEAKDQNGQLTAQRTELQKQAQKALEQRQMAEKKLDAVTKDISILNSTISEAQDILQTSTTGNQALNSLLKDARKIGGGIYGRLGDLGTIEERFDVAISTACTMLNYIVVDTTETGQKCVEYLRKNNLGRASFIILEKMKAPLDSKDQLPQGIQRLFDLIKVNNKQLLPAFYHAIGETFVAVNMELATKMAYSGPKRHRVVTLDGKLIDTSGTMSGGGKHLLRGAMKLAKASSHHQPEDQQPEISEEQVEQLEQVLNQKHEEQTRLRSMISEFTRSLTMLSKELKTIELELAKVTLVLSSLPLQIEDLLGQLKQQSDKSTKTTDQQKQQSQLESELKKAEKAHLKAQNDMKPLKIEIEKLEQEVMESGGVKFKVQRAKVDGLREQLGHITNRLSKVHAEISSYSSGSTTVRPSTKADEKKHEEIERELNEINVQMDQTTNEAVKLKSKLDNLSASMEDEQEVIMDLKKSLEQHNKILAKFRKQEFELKMRREELEKECEDQAHALKGYENALNSLKLNNYAQQYLF